MKKGFTLIELLISVSFMMILTLLAISLLSKSIFIQDRLISEKDLMYISDEVSEFIIEEFTNAKKVYAIDSSGLILNNFDDKVEVNAIKFELDEKFSGKDHKFIVVFKESYDDVKRRPVKVIKSKSDIDLDFFGKYPNYEIGTHLNKIFITRFDSNLLKIELEFKYQNKDIFYKKEFFVTMQN